MPYQCIKDAEENLKNTILYYNKHKLADKGMSLRYRKGYSTAWLELQLPTHTVINESGSQDSSFENKDQLQLYSELGTNENSQNNSYVIDEEIEMQQVKVEQKVSIIQSEFETQEE